MRMAMPLLVASLAFPAQAYEVVGQISSTQQLTVDFLNARVVLNDGLHTAFVSTTGQFKFEDIDPGMYHLDVYEPNLKFRKYKVDVSTKKGGTIRALSKPFPGGEKKMENYPLMIQAIAPEVYFKARGAANPLAMVFRNPIFLIMGLFAVLKVFAGSPAEEADPQEPGQQGEPVAEIDTAEGSSNDNKKNNGRSKRGKRASAPAVAVATSTANDNADDTDNDMPSLESKVAEEGLRHRGVDHTDGVDID